MYIMHDDVAENYTYVNTHTQSKKKFMYSVFFFFFFLISSASPMSDHRPSAPRVTIYKMIDRYYFYGT